VTTTIYTNNAITTVANAVAVGDTTVTVKAGTGSLFATLSGGSVQVATFCDPLFTVFEVVLVTARSSDTFTITRAQENTTAQTWAVGSNFFAGVTAGVLGLYPQIASAATISGLWNYTTAPTINGASIWTSANITPAPLNTTATITGSWTYNTLPNYYNGTTTFQFLTTNGGTLAAPLYLSSDPTVTNQAATKNYVDSKVSGLTPHPSVSAASTGSNVNVTSAPAALDGVTLVNGARILLKDQTNTNQNIVWIFNGAGNALTQPTDFTGTISTQIQGTSVFVSGGTLNVNSTWSIITSATSGTWGSVAVSWSQTGGAALLSSGNGINIASNTISVVVNTTTNNLVSNSSGVDLNAISGLVGNVGATLTTGGTGSQYNNFTVDTYGRINAAGTAPYALLTSAVFTGTLQRTTSPLTTNPNDVVNVSFLQNQIGTYVLTKQPVACVATTNVTTLSGLQTIDGYTLKANDRILLVGQSTASQNGPYVASSGTWANAGSTDGLSYGAVYSVMNGTVNSNNLFMLTTTGSITPGTTNLTFARINGLGQVLSPVNTSGGLSIVNNTISLYQTGVTAGSYNAATITVDVYGRITAASNNVSGVSSVFGRTGTVVAQAGDYNFSQLGNIPTTLAGYGITDPVLYRSGGNNTMTQILYLSQADGTYNDQLWVYNTTVSTSNPAFVFKKASALVMNINSWDGTATGANGTLNVNTAAFTYKGSTILTASNYGVWTYVGFTSTSTNITAVNNGNYSADTSTNVGTIYLPASPTQGMQVTVQDAGQSFGTNNLTVSRNGSNIAGSANDLLLNQTGMGVSLVYIGTNKAGTVVGWAPYFNY
jgi:hypothetical protein